MNISPRMQRVIEGGYEAAGEDFASIEELILVNLDAGKDEDVILATILDALDRVLIERAQWN